MPTVPTGTKKTLQELSRVFNKLASELTSELTHAKAEIENLRREVQRLKSSPARSNAQKQSKTQRSGRSASHPTKRSSSSSSTSNSRERNQNSTVSSSSSNLDTAEYIFPREPFNPPAPPEPSPPSNN